MFSEPHTAFIRQAAADDLTRRYQELCDHYGMRPTRNNRGKAHENGSVESAHGHLKRAIEQALLLRGSGDFDDLAAYRAFIAEIVGRHNARHRARIDAERASLGPLPARRAQDFELERVQVTSHSGFTLRKVFYSVPSRLIGHTLRVHLYDDRLELFVGSCPLLTLRRGRAHSDGRRGHVVDYHHLIHALRRKPMALLHLVYRDQLFPRDAYRRTFDALLDTLDERAACRCMVGLLALAHDRCCEAALAARLADLLATGTLPELEPLEAHFAPDPQSLPQLDVCLGSPTDYNDLLDHPAELATVPAGAA